MSDIVVLASGRREEWNKEEEDRLGWCSRGGAAVAWQRSSKECQEEIKEEEADPEYFL